MMIRNSPEGRLSLWELDLSGVPGKLDCSVTRSLLVLRRQKAVLESFGIPGKLNFPSLQQTAVMCSQFGNSSSRMLSRSTPSHDDSGWFFGCEGMEHDHNLRENLLGGTLYGLACANRVVLDFLAMPEGSIVLLNKKGDVTMAFGRSGEALQILPGSYLDLKHRNGGAGGGT